MITVPLTFLRPTKTMRELFLLLSVQESRHLSQHQLARRIGVSSAMANNYMTDLTSRGLVTASGRTNRSMKYEVTAQGRDRLTFLMSGYSKEIARMYSIAKQETEKRLVQLYAQGLKRVVLFGAAETGELVYSAAKATPMKIVGLVDNDVTKHRKLFGEIPVSPPDTIESFQPDGVLIASSGNAEEILKQLHPLSQKGVPVVTL
jgi:predicted transcriptional regulator